MRLAVFDLDGTLADTSGDLIAAANRYFAGLGADGILCPRADRLIAFDGGRAMLRTGHARLGRPLASDAIDAAYPVILDHYERHIAVHTRLYPGTEAALDRLEAAGWGLAVCTNKPAALAALLLERLGIARRFRAMLGGDSLPVRKPDPRHLIETIRQAGGAPERALMVGDTGNDAQAARAAGVPCVLVAFDGPERAAALSAEAVIHAYDALPGLAERLVPARAA